MKYLRKLSKKTWFLLGSAALAIFYIEVYLYGCSEWKQLECKNRDACSRILLVADPQLIGVKNEVLHFITPVSIWDSDRYLRKTYSAAFEHVRPDIVIFLGDLLDEGSTASDTEFIAYLKRFMAIFSIGDPSRSVKHLFIPGDNDVGGEGGDFLTTDKLQRFERAFMQPDMSKYRNLTFYKINRMTRATPKFAEQDFFDTKEIRIALSHMPLIFQPSTFVNKLCAKLQPHLLLAAHTHASMVVTMDGLVQTDRQIFPVTREDNKVFDFTLGTSDMYEILVPTCSYRMGTKKLGYGFVVIENNSAMQYTVLWLPERFKQLHYYLVLMGFYGLYMLYQLVVNCWCKHKKYSKFGNV